MISGARGGDCARRVCCQHVLRRTWLTPIALVHVYGVFKLSEAWTDQRQRRLVDWLEGTVHRAKPNTHAGFRSRCCRHSVASSLAIDGGRVSTKGE